MNQDPKPVSIIILDKEYLISCTDDERDQLHIAAKYLSEKLQELKNTGRVIGTERIAVMTALNIASELLSCKSENNDYTDTIDTTIRRLHNKIEVALDKGPPLQA